MGRERREWRFYGGGLRMEWENRGLLGYPEEYYEDSVIAPDFLWI